MIASAVTKRSSTTPWVQSFSYDGFGNLTGKTLNGTTTSIAVNAATNRLTNASYDANGNMTSGAEVGIGYDPSNRVASVSPVSGGTAYYGYDASNRRIYSNTPSGGEIWTFYGGYGERLGTFNLVDWSTKVSQYQNQWTMPAHILSSVVWFGGQIVWDGGVVTEDRLGTRARVYPYGEEIGTATANDRVKFATYTRDAFSGLDYAQQRYYASAYGKFTSADPGWIGTASERPDSWNRYAYVEGDPVNFNDPEGLFRPAPDPAPIPDPDPVPSPVRGLGPSQPIPHRPQDPGVNRIERGKLKKRLTKFGNTNCDKVFRSVIEDYSTQGLVAEVNIIQFYDGTSPVDGRFTQNQIIGNGSGVTLAATVGVGTLAPANAVRLTGSGVEAVILGSNYFSDSAAGQENTLLHELLHVYTNWDDSDIFSAFASKGLQHINNGSGDITSWLSTDCQSTPKEVR